MHFVIGILIAAASLVYWLGMASKGAREISSTASGLKNMPRKRRFQKKAAQSALELINDPVEAAIVSMIAVSRANDDGRVSEIESACIHDLLVENMQWTRDHAEDMLIQLKANTSQIVLHDTLMMAMIDVLRGTVDAAEAADLASMLEMVAQSDGPMNPDQKEMIHRFKERLGVGY